MPFWRQDVGQNILVGLALVLLLVVGGLKFTFALEHLNNFFTDTQIGLLPKRELSPLPVIVAVDEKSLAAYGQWPWPRFRVAQLVQAIHKAGASAVGIDALFVESDRTSPSTVQGELKNNFKQDLVSLKTHESLPDYDEIFGNILKTGPFVLGYLFSFDGVSKNPCSPKTIGILQRPSKSGEQASQISQSSNIVCNIPPIQNCAASSGFINSAPDDDGLFRRTPLLIAFHNRLYPSLALQTFLAAAKISHIEIEPDNSGIKLKIGEFSVPLDHAGNLLGKLPANRQQFQKLSAVDFLSGTIPEHKLKNKIALIGVSATGLHEVRPTPYDPHFLGVEMHAAIIDNLDRKDFLQRPANAFWFELLVAAGLSLSLMIGLNQSKPLTSGIIPLLLIIGLITLSQLVLTKTGIVLSPALPVAMILLTLLMLALMKYRREYLHADEMAKLVAQTQEGIIESFCSMSEYRDPETGAHIKRTQNYIKTLAEYLKEHPKFKGILTPDTIELFYKAAPLHDIGKIGIRDHILLKPGGLAEDEMAIMRSHPTIGAEIIKSVANQIGWNPFMRIAHEISLCHQEKWDGSGYPQGLAGEDIPLSARFMALADVYDALISKRVYKPAFSHSTAVTIMKKTAGTHFDPILAQAFEEIHLQFREIALQFLDEESQRDTLLANE